MASDLDSPQPPGRLKVPIQPQIGLWDGVSIVIGIVVGVTIFKAPPLVFSNVSGPWAGIGAWALGGALSLAGALCYAELASAYPRSGGDYVYLTRAYGPCVGFLFGWAQLVAILTGSVGALSYVFADYAVEVCGCESGLGVWFAAAAVAALSLLNLLGVVFGKAAQNVLTLAKLAGLAGIVASALVGGGPKSMAVERPASGPGFGLAMILIFYAYGGWSDAAYVAAEVRDPKRNIPRVLIFGTSAVTLLYLLVNGAYLWGMGFEGLRSSRTPASDVFGTVFGGGGMKAMCVLVMVSALGGINGLIFTGSRVYATLGEDHRVFAWLGRWHPRLGTPVWSLLAQAGVALAMIVSVGTPSGRNALDGLMVGVGLSPLPWDRFGGGFDTLVSITAPVFWSFFLLTGMSVLVLRAKDPDHPRPFRVPLYPVLPVIFCLSSLWMLYSSIAYAKGLSLLGIVSLGLGLPLYFLSRRERGGEK